MKRSVVVLAGGSGDRFWPLSTPERPKQLLALAGAESLLAQALRRARELAGPDDVWVAAGPASADALREEFGGARLLVEPAKRNTLGGICWALARSMAEEPDSDPTVAVLPSDHAIGDEEAFARTLDVAFDKAESDGGLGTIGIRPSRPETGYGYLELETEPVPRRAQHVVRFREKPNVDEAERFVQSGKFLWNAGMFVWKRSSFLAELDRAQPEAHGVLLDVVAAIQANDEAAAALAFERFPNLSVDYGVMEKALDVWVVPAEFGWDDLGSWDALARTLAPDDSGNVIRGDVIAVDAKGCVLYSELGATPVAILGVRDLVVVATENGILVCPKSDAQRVREVVEKLRDQ